MTSKLIVLACLLAVSQSRHLNPISNFLSPRVIGGKDAKPGQFPHQVSLQLGMLPVMPFQHFCGGSILNDKWILTAAHCIDPVRQNPQYTFLVKSGKHDLSKIEDTQQTSTVENYYSHPKWSGTEEPGPYDIALVRLKDPLRFNARVTPISLPEIETEPSGQVTVSGWGAIDNVQNYPKILQTVGMSIVNRKACNKAFKDVISESGYLLDKDLIDETNICTGPLTGGIAVCSGDSGGPLIIEKNGKREIVGIVSWGMKWCGLKGAPSVYTRVSHFIDWITEIMAKN